MPWAVLNSFFSSCTNNYRASAANLKSQLRKETEKIQRAYDKMMASFATLKLEQKLMEKEGKSLSDVETAKCYNADRENKRQAILTSSNVKLKWSLKNREKNLSAGPEFQHKSECLPANEEETTESFGCAHREHSEK